MVNSNLIEPRARKERCAECDNTGWKEIVTEEPGPGGTTVTVSRRVRCDHGAGTRPLAGFEGAGAILERLAHDPRLKDLFTGADLQVAEIIMEHRGEANPVQIEEIGKKLWPEEWAEKQAAIERHIKDSVSRL